MAEKMTAEQMTQFIRGGGYHCSQAVLGHIAQDLGMDRELALKISGTLGGGCYSGGTCGAVTGACLALGLAYGFSEPGAKEQNMLMIGKVKEFEKRFAALHGELSCKGLLGGYNIGDPAEQKLIVEQGLNKKCPGMCADAYNILVDMLTEDGIL